MKKLVAIGGGENGRVLKDGTIMPYDTESIDREIVNLTGKERPNFLFICHAMESLEIQDSYYHTMGKIYGGIFGCHCKDLKTDELEDTLIVQEKINWADIIYEGGGDTKYMIELWKKTGFDKVLYKAWNDGKVICGISAGAICWFKNGNSDVDDTFENLECLNWFNAYATPHADEAGRSESTKEHLKNENIVGIMLSNKSALEIINNKCRVLLSDYDDKSYAIKCYWNNDNYTEKNIVPDKPIDIEYLVSEN